MNFYFCIRMFALLNTTLTIAFVLGCSPQSNVPSKKNRPQPSYQKSTKSAKSAADMKAGQFTRLPPEYTGVDLVNRVIADHPLRRIFNSGFVCGGVAIGDVNQDGRPDIYCVSGPFENRLYVQTADFRFKDVTQTAGVSGDEAWGTGACLKDIDNDGDLDIYVCNYESPNQCFINQGDGKFVEAAAERGLNIVTSSVMGSFCDYDLDGDLDLYLLTNRFYRAGGRPKEPPFEVVNGTPQVKPEFARYYAIKKTDTGYQMDDYGQPDILLENVDGVFRDVTHESGIQGNGFGLSATWWDYNLDGLPDLYVANDYDDPDCLYRNDGNGRFTNVLKNALPHTPWFSMGSDFGDLNNDGLFDLLVVDMSATNHFAQKTTMGAMSAEKLARVAGPPPQLMRNALFLNTGTERFQEAAFLAGMANTDWSWSVKIADFDKDGHQDVFVTNGVVRNINDSDRPVTDEMRIGHEEWEYYADGPTRPEQNLAFRNEGDLRFTDVSKAWGLDHVGMSYASALADLDNDGDLDIVVANLDEPISIYRNDLQGRTNDVPNRFLSLRLRGTQSNSHGIGAIVRMETPDGRQQIKQMPSSTGFAGDNESILHFGLGSQESVSRLTINWPSGIRQSLQNVSANQILTVTEPKNAEPQVAELAGTTGLQSDASNQRPMFRGGPISIRHIDDEFDDFQLQPLLPNKLSHFGPGMAVVDVDGDGWEDVFLTGSAGHSGRLFLRESDGRLRPTSQPAFEEDRDAEDVGCAFFDADGDGDADLYVASGSVENIHRAELFQDRLYLNDGTGIFRRADNSIPKSLESTKSVAPCDFDQDGDIDLFVGGRLRPGHYPLAPKSQLLENQNGQFVDVTDLKAPELRTAGMVTSACWADVNRDSRPDLMVTTDWGPVRCFVNLEGNLTEQTEAFGLSSRSGWWNAIEAADFDGDDDVDFVITNFGLNTKYQASADHPALLYYGDFENNGRMQLVEAEKENETWFPVRGKSCSTKAMPHLADKFKTYHDFALASLDEIYSEERLKQSHRFAATELRSGILINERGRFRFHPLPRIAQISPSLAVATTDFDGDGHIDIFLAQNFFAPQPETGRMDSGVGQLLLGTGDGHFRSIRPDRSGIVIPDDCRSVIVVDLNHDGHRDLLVATNNGPVYTWINQGQGDASH